MSQVSIIIPVYNSDKYIKRCLQSLIHQSLQDIEIIFIDDGSIDNSASIIKEFIKKDKRIHYYYQQNQGPSVARNKGINLATGKFIAFVDSDDWVEKDMYMIMVEAAINNELDVVICSYINDYNFKDSEQAVFNLPEDTIIHKCKFPKLIYKEMMKDSIFNGACNKIYRKDLINKINKEMVRGLNYGEDLIFQLEIFDKIDKTFFINKPLYHYVHRENSLTSRVKENMICSVFIPMYNIRKVYAQEWGISQNLVMRYFIYYSLMDLINSVNEKSYLQKKEIIKKSYMSNPELLDAFRQSSVWGTSSSIKLIILFYLLKFKLDSVAAALL